MIDTNVILDDILVRAPNAQSARKISRLVENGSINAYVTANSITDIYYIVSKYKNDEIARKVIRNLLTTYNVIGIDGQDCLSALDLPLSDFEDSIVVVCAEKAALDYIVTNDTEFLSTMGLRVPAISPDGFLSKY